MLKAAQFEAAFAVCGNKTPQVRGQKFGDSVFGIVSAPNDASNARLGLIVAKKTAKRAHERNRLKRIIRESFRQQRHKLPAWDIIVQARHGAPLLDNPALFVALEKVWQRFHKYAKNPTTPITAPNTPVPTDIKPAAV